MNQVSNRAAYFVLNKPNEMTVSSIWSFISEHQTHE
jgi:hypothetical protein